MAQQPGLDATIIRLNANWSPDKAEQEPLEEVKTLQDFPGKKVVITLPGAGGFCNKEFASVKENLGRFQQAGADEVFLIVGADILTNASHDLPNIWQDVNLEFAEANGIRLQGVLSRYPERTLMLIDENGEQILKETAPLLACRNIAQLVEQTQEGFAEAGAQA